MKHDYFVDGFNFFKLLLEFVVVRLKNLNLHVIHVVFAELKHSVTKSIGKLKATLHVAFFGLLMGTPYVFKVFLCIFTLKKVTENQLVFIYRLFRNY
jgi:ABC-type phosphate/phosphonate transport system permease subunit